MVKDATYIFDSRYKLLGDSCTHDQILKLNIFTGLFVQLHGFDESNDTGKLPLPASLFLMRVLKFRAPSYCFTERHPRLASGACHVVLTPHALNIDFKMEFAHTGYNCLPLSAIRPQGE